MRLTPTVRYGLSLFVVAVMGYLLYAYGGISYEEIWQALTRFSWAGVLGAFGCVLIQHVFMILRVRSLFHEPISILQVAHAITYGQVTNTFLPARAGDVLKVLLLKPGSIDSRGVPILTGTGILLSDKIVDTLSLVLLIVLSQTYAIPEFPLKWEAIGGAWPLGILVPLLIGVFFIIRKKKPEAMAKLGMGFRAITHPKTFFLSIAIGLGAWSSEAFAIQILAWSQGFEFTFGESVFVLSVLNLAIAIPISVANVGAFEGGLVFATKLLKVPMNIGTAIGAVYHLLQMAGVLACAGVVFVILRMRKIPRQQVVVAALNLCLLPHLI